MTREELIGEPLTKEEVKELVKGCLKTRRQLNMGRDGLTHNMLDNIHAHWKRRRVCKIKCKGVCTVDMDNVHQQLEEKTGGKIIYGKGGVIFLFRGRNYNYRTRPRYPLMLWKPITPVYPRLIPRVPEGLTLEEAAEMRKRGRHLPPICKLGKNGMYSNLVKNVKEAFEACELVRIDCKGLNNSDCRKIGAKLKDLVPCVLISFEFEHILMWRGREWKSSLPPSEDNHNEALDLIADDSSTVASSISDLVGHESMELIAETSVNKVPNSMIAHETLDFLDLEPSTDSGIGKSSAEELRHEIPLVDESPTIDTIGSNSEERMLPTDSFNQDYPVRPQRECLNGIMSLLGQAVESGGAVILDEDQLDANIVYQRSVALAKTAPAGPVFRHRIRKVVVQNVEKEKSDDDEEQGAEVGAIIVSEKRSNGNNPRSRRKEEFKPVFADVLPHGSLRVDELAKLLS